MPDESSSVRVGHYLITEFGDGSLWVKNDSGEGFAVPKNNDLMENLEKLIHMFFCEHF